MAAFGAKNPCFAPFSDGKEPKDALPSYGEMTVLGKLVQANVTINLANGEMYGDDVLAEQVSEFVSGACAMDTDDITAETAAKVYGATYDKESEEVVYNSGDNPPLGGLSYYKSIMRDGVKYFRGFFYPKVRAAIGNDNAQTKGSSITFQPTSTPFTIMAPNTGDWRYTHETKTEADVIEWQRKKFGVTPETKSEEDGTEG